LADQACHDVGATSGGKSDNDAHRPRRIGLREGEARHGRQRSNACGQMQKSTAGNFHSVPQVVPLAHRLSCRRVDHEHPFAAVHESAYCRFCCNSLFELVIKISFGCTHDFRVKMWGTSLREDKPTGDLGNVIEAT
jgi:hypothetical protein